MFVAAAPACAVRLALRDPAQPICQAVVSHRVSPGSVHNCHTGSPGCSDWSSVGQPGPWALRSLLRLVSDAAGLAPSLGVEMAIQTVVAGSKPEEMTVVMGKMATWVFS